MPEDAKIGYVMPSAARATPGVCRRGRPPCLCSPVFHTHLLLSCPPFICTNFRAVQPLGRQQHEFFLSVCSRTRCAGHGGLTVSQTPTGTPDPVPEIRRRRTAAPPGAPPGPRLARSPSSAAPGRDAGERAGTARTRPKVCELSTCPLG